MPWARMSMPGNLSFRSLKGGAVVFHPQVENRCRTEPGRTVPHRAKSLGIVTFPCPRWRHHGISQAGDWKGVASSTSLPKFLPGISKTIQILDSNSPLYFQFIRQRKHTDLLPSLLSPKFSRGPRPLDQRPVNLQVVSRHSLERKSSLSDLPAGR